ncbi:zinc ribbon domain-containing protein [Bacillus sp. MM2020_1]|nr:zinc ribbon domain-containing protein [Bacillus sp. MM2020_1]
MQSGNLQDQQLREYALKLQNWTFTSSRHKALEQLNRKSASWTCSNCGNEIGTNDKFCGSCGQQQVPITTRANTRNRRWLLWTNTYKWFP